MLAAMLGCAMALSDTSRVSFALEDQFGRLYTNQMLSGRVSVVVYADRAGANYTAEWVDGVRATLGTEATSPRLAVVRIANLRGIPRLLRWQARRSFSHDTSEGVLLDWDGRLAVQHQLRSGVSILVINATGDTVECLTGLSRPPDGVITAIGAQLRLLLKHGMGID